MAVQLTTNANYGYTILKYFKVPDALIAQSKAAGVEVNQASPGTFTVKYAGKTFGMVSVKGQAISLAKQGVLGPASLEAVKAQFEQALKNALDNVPTGAAATAASSIDEPVAFGLNVPNATGTKVPASSVFSASGASLPLVKLADAVAPMQKVSGTNKTSIYRAVALFKGLNIGFRLHGGTLSIRVEGKALSSYKEVLAEEFKLDVNNGYMSGHFELPKEYGSPNTLSAKTLGALVATLGTANLIQMADTEALSLIAD